MEDEKDPKFTDDAIDSILDLPDTKPAEKVKKNETTRDITISPSIKLGNDYEIETSQNIQNDFEQARATYQEVIEKGRDTLTYLVELAKGTDKFEYFDSIAKLMKETADVAKKLMENEQAKLDLDRQMTPVENHIANITNNNVFVGSTKELLEMINDAKNKKTIQVQST